MKITMSLVAASCLLLTGACAFAAAKPCEELKAEIAAKLEAGSVTGYALDVVDADKDDGRKVVGTCEGGSRKIVYSKK